MKNFLICCLIFNCISAYSQNVDTLSIINIKNGKKKVIDKWDEIKVYSKIDSIGYSSFQRTLGGYLGQNKDSIFIQAESQRISSDYSTANGEPLYYSSSRIYYEDENDSVNGGKIAIAKSNCRKILVNNHGWRTYTYLEETAKLSAVVALLVAPLISINYRNGDFNSKRYYWTAGSSAALAIISYRLSLTFRFKEYKIAKNKFDLQ